MTQNFQFKQLIKQDQDLHVLVLRFFLLQQVVGIPTRWSDFRPLALLPTKWLDFLPPEVLGNPTNCAS